MIHTDMIVSKYRQGRSGNNWFYPQPSANFINVRFVACHLSYVRWWTTENKNMIYDTRSEVYRKSEGSAELVYYWNAKTYCIDVIRQWWVADGEDDVAHEWEIVDYITKVGDLQKAMA